MARKRAFILAALLGLLVQTWAASAQTYGDLVYGFKVTPPDSWQTNVIADGKVQKLQMLSPDGKALAQIEAIHLARGDTLTDLTETFIATAFPQATLVGSQPEVQGSLAGEVSAWTIIEGGQQMIVGGFFAIDGPVGYILWTKTTRADYYTYSDRIDEIFNTFSPGTLVTAYVGDAPSAKPEDGAVMQARQFDQAQMFENLVAEVHPELGFVFVRYESWQPDQPAPYSLRVGLMEYPAQMRPSVVIEALAGAAYPSLQAGAEDLKSQLSNLPQIKFDQDGPHQVPNMSEQGVMMDGWSFGASYVHEGVPFRQLTFLFKRKSPSVYYVVYVTAPQEILPRHQPEMLRMLQAIQIVPFQ